MRLLLIAILLLLPSIANAADPSSVAIDSGTFNEGGEVVISGANFGTKTTVTPYRNDNFESGTLGTRLDTVSEASGGWSLFSYAGKTYSEYSDTVIRYPGTQSAYQEFITDGSSSNYIKLTQFTPTTTLYVSAWFNFDSFGPPSRNAKVINFINSGGWQSRIDTYPHKSPSGHLYAYEYCAGGGNIADWGVKDSNVLLPDGNWHRIETYLDQGTAGGGGYRDVWVDGVKIGDISGTFVDGSCSVDSINFGHYFATDYQESGYQYNDSYSCSAYITGTIRKSFGKWYTCEADGTYDAGVSTKPTPIPSAERYWDEIYVQNTRSRVELCNASTWGTSGKTCEIQNPTAWASGEITIDAHLGASFESGNTAYVYVVNEDGDVNASGLKITIGEGTVDTTPPVMSGGSPSGTLDSGTTSVDMTLGTNETATCKYHASDVAYASMGSTFTTTAAQTHSETLTSLSDGNTYTYYIRCQDDEGTPNVNTSSLVITFSIATGADTCAEDVTLCDNETDCTAEWSYNFCSEETPPCQSAACANSCDEDHFYLCETQSPCESAGLYWWEGACRTVVQPQNINGVNLLSNPDVTQVTWTAGIPAGWDSYQPAEENVLGAKLFDNGQIYQDDIVENLTRYCYAFNIISIEGQISIYHYNTDHFYSTVGTKTGCFETPSDIGIYDALYFQTAVGANNGIANHFGLWFESAGTKAIFGTGTAASIGTSGTVMSVGN